MSTINIKTINGGQAAIETGQIKEFKAGFQGMVLVPEDDGYDSAREIWNAIFN